MKTSAQMQALITHLLEKQGVALTAPTTFLWLALPERAERLVIERIDERSLSVALARGAQLGDFTLAPQLCLATDATGWTPIHLAGVEAVSDLTQFVETWAERILAEGWLERGEPRPEPPWAGPFSATDDDADPAQTEYKEEPCALPF